MKTHFLIICFALSSAAWAAESTPPTAPATSETPAAEQPTNPPTAEQSQTATTPSEQTSTPDEQAGFSRGSVVRSVFSTEVVDREPVDKLNGSKTNVDHVYFFTELRDMSGQTAIHRWEHNGKVAAEVKFNVRGPRWRVWSSKTFSPNATGEWKVSVLNGAGEVIAEDMIDYTGPAAEQQPAADKPAAEETQAPAAGGQPPSPPAMQ